MFTFGIYESINKNLIYFIETTAKLNNDQDIALKATAINNLMIAQGIINNTRSLGYSAIVAKRPTGILALKNYNTVFYELNKTIEYLKRVLTGDILKNLNDELGKHNVIQAQEKLQHLAYRQPLGQLIEFEAREWLDQLQAYDNGIRLVSDRLVEVMKSDIDHKLTIVNHAYIRNFASLLVMLLTLIGLSFYIIRSIRLPLLELVEDFNYVSETKDISARQISHSKDEISSVQIGFNALILSFNEAIAKVKQQSEQLSQVTQLVETALNDTANAAHKQIECTDSVSVAMEQMTASVGEVAKNASLTSETVSVVHHSSTQSIALVETTKRQMKELVQELVDTSSVISQLKEDSDSISNVLGVIQSVAEQTNLLALNAAIEAARAGEQGRGFAVVADEVRSLAIRTQESTQQIREQISALQSGVESAVVGISKLESKGGESITAVESSAEQFSELRDKLDNVADMSLQISTAAEEQSIVSQEINERIHSVRDDAESMAHTANDVQQDCNMLRLTETVLNRCVDEFKLFG